MWPVNQIIGGLLFTVLKCFCMRDVGIQLEHHFSGSRFSTYLRSRCGRMLIYFPSQLVMSAPDVFQGVHFGFHAAAAWLCIVVTKHVVALSRFVATLLTFSKVIPAWLFPEGIYLRICWPLTASAFECVLNLCRLVLRPACASGVRQSLVTCGFCLAYAVISIVFLGFFFFLVAVPALFVSWRCCCVRRECDMSRFLWEPSAAKPHFWEDNTLHSRFVILRAMSFCFSLLPPLLWSLEQLECCDFGAEISCKSRQNFP